jgi:hypothetical protein
MHNPNVYRQWIVSGKDIRKLNPNGVYLKHINLRTIDSTQREPSVEGHPDYDWIHANHPEWILHDANGKTIPLFIPTEECLDFGNDAYLDWVLNTWMPNNYFDSTDSDLAAVMWYLQDNGQFLKLNVTCAANDPVCQKYTTDTGVQTAFKHMFDRFHAKYPNKRIFVSTGPLSYMTPEQQLPWMEDVLSHADGYFSESLTNDHCYWNSQPNSAKRNALTATLQLADWLASKGKYFFPNLGMGDGTQPTQAQVNYGFAFFNLLRNGNNQFFSIVKKDSSGNWQPRTYPEQNLALGNATETRQQTSPNVYRRTFQNAIAYVNLSDGQVSIALPAGSWKNSLGQAVASPLTLPSFSGLTVYGSTSQPTPSPTPTATPKASPTPIPPIALPYDFNHDRRPDYVLYKASTRQTYVWYMHNYVLVGGASGPTLPAGWSLIDVADFNRDGNNDYALFNASTRQTAIWYLSGTMLTGGAWGPILPSGWAPVATGDFNGNGKTDFVLYNASTRRTLFWYLNNNVYVGGAYGPTLPAGCRLVGVADFNRNGTTDYALFNASTRQTAIYYLSGTMYVSSAFGPTIASGYELRGTADFNGNGKPNYVLYNASSRQTALYYLNNNVYVGSALGPVLPAGWSLAAP